MPNLISWIELTRTIPESLYIHDLFLACNIEDEPLRNGSSSIIGIGPGQSLQQGDHDSTNKSFGNLNGTLDNKTQAPTASSNSHEQSINSMPLNRISNVHPRNSIYQASTTTPVYDDKNKPNNQNNSSPNQSLSQTPPPPPMPPIQSLTASKNNYSGMGTHVWNSLKFPTWIPG